MRLIYILLLLNVVNSQYSEKDCQEVLMYFNYGMKINEVLNMLSEDGTFVIDKIPSILDNSYTQIGSSAGTLLYKKYLKNYVVECHQFYWNEYQKKTEAEQAKKMKLEAEEEERRAERKSHNARADKIQSIIGWVLFIIVMGLVLAFVCFCIYCLYEDLSKNYIFFERRIKK